MSIGPLGTSRIGAVAAAGGGGAAAEAVVGALAGRIAARLGEALDLGVDPDRRGRRSLPSHDIYGIEAMADALAARVGGRLSDRPRLAEALNRFAETCATLIAARPSAGTMAMIRATIHAEGDDWRSADEAVAAIDRISAGLERSR